MASDRFPGLPARGVSPDPRLEAWLRDAPDLWRRFEETLPGGLRGFLDGPSRPWVEESARDRSAAVGMLAETFRELAAVRMAEVEAGERSLTAWRDELTDRGHRMAAAAALVQAGDELTGMSRRRLSAANQQLEVRLAELARRAELEPEDPEGISPAQARAWAAQSGRGLIGAAGLMASVQEYEGRPVSRVMTAFESHCSTCPGKAGLYASVEAMVEACGGWPGDGSDQCHGNCMCSIEPATEYSVYGDEDEGLLDPAGPDVPPPPPVEPSTPGGLAGMLSRLVSRGRNWLAGLRRRGQRAEEPVRGAPGRGGRDLAPEEVTKLLSGLAPLVDEPVEHLVIFDRRGRELLRTTGDEMSVALPAGDWRGAIVVHTHPWSDELRLLGLDPDDLSVMARNQPHIAAVVYRWNSRIYLQTLSAEDGEWPDHEIAKRALAKEMLKVKGRQQRGRVPEKEDPLHVALERLAPHLRLRYHRMEVDT